jgi:CheY-like chemotaxis protein
LLSIRERVELLKGRMRIESAKDKGSRFSIIVPTSEQPAASPSPLEAEITEPKTARVHGDHRLRVLLADDHAIVRQGLTCLLSEERAIQVVGEATDGREAVELADRLAPDVVIMDVSMPSIGGDGATRQIKALRPQTRVIAYSMYEEPEKREMMRQAGAEQYVLKTASSEELLTAIRGTNRDM